MADMSSSQSTPHTEAEYRAALSVYIAETQNLLEEMQAEQMEIDRLKEEGRALHSEIESLGSQTRAILSQVEAMI